MAKFETSDHLPRYFKEIDEVSGNLTKEQEKALADRIHGTDKADAEAALETLIHANLKYVVTVANTFIGMGLPVSDLIQEGNLALIEAAKRFTSDKDVKFLTYAKFWIKKRLNLALCDHGRTVRLPVNQEYAIYKRKMKGETVNLSNIRIDSKIGEDHDGNLGDLILHEEFNDPFANEEQRMILNKVMASLKESEKRIVSLFYGLEGDGLSTKDVATVMGMKPEEVNRALKIARLKMRRAVGL